MKKAFFALFFSGIAAVSLADYAANIKYGNYYYKAGQYSKAMPYYSAAYREKPNEQLGNFIDSLKLRIPAAGESEPLPDLNTGAQKGSDSPNWLMWGLDAGFAVLGVVSYINVQTSFKRYHELYNQWRNYMDQSAYDQMDKARSSGQLWADAAGTCAGAVAAVTGSLIADAVIFGGMEKGGRPDAVIFPDKDGIELAVNYSF